MKKHEKTVKQFNEAIKKHGNEVTYFPVLGRKDGAKKTFVRGDAFLDGSGFPVVFVEGVRGYVAVENIEITVG